MRGPCYGCRFATDRRLQVLQAGGLETIDLDAVKSRATRSNLTYRVHKAGFVSKRCPLSSDRTRGDSKMSSNIVTEAMLNVAQVRGLTTTRALCCAARRSPQN